MPVPSPVLAEYGSLVLPDLVRSTTIMALFDMDPWWNDMRKQRRVRRQGGTKVQLTRVRKSDITWTEVAVGTTSINASHTNIFTQVEGDWKHYIGIIVFPWVERDRLVDAADVTRWVRLRTLAAALDTGNKVRRQVYHGKAGVAGEDPNNLFKGIGTLNGFMTGLPSLGLENGAMRFQTPAAQAAAAVTYLTETRANDTTDDIDNWHNQFATHNGFGSGSWELIEHQLDRADSYSDDELGGRVEHILLSMTTMREFRTEIRESSGGTSRVSYTPSDIKAGRVFATTEIVNGRKFYYPRQFNDALIGTAGGAGSTQPLYCINPTTWDWWVNRNNEFQSDGKMVDGKYALKVFDYTEMHAQCQLACKKLPANACLRQS